MSPNLISMGFRRNSLARVCTSRGHVAVKNMVCRSVGSLAMMVRICGSNPISNLIMSMSLIRSNGKEEGRGGSERFG